MKQRKGQLQKEEGTMHQDVEAKQILNF